MINFFYFIFFLSFLFSENCINNLYNSILKNIDKDIFKIDVLADVYSRDNNSYYKTIDLSLFVNLEKKEISIDIDNQIIILNQNKSKLFYKDTNQLYIDYPDSSLIDSIFSILNGNYYDSFIEKEENIFILENKFNLENILLEFNRGCERIIFFEFVNENSKIKGKNIQINTISIMDLNNHLNISDDYFEFDLR